MTIIYLLLALGYAALAIAHLLEALQVFYASAEARRVAWNQPASLPDLNSGPATWFQG